MGKASGYGWGVLASLLLHGVLLALLIVGWVPKHRPEPVQPSFIHATLMGETPKSRRAEKPAVKPPPAEEKPEPPEEPEPDRQEIQRQQEQQRQEELRQKQVAERKKQQEAEKQRQLDLKKKQQAEEKRKQEEEAKKKKEEEQKKAQAKQEQEKKDEQRRRDAERKAAAEKRRREQEMAEALAQEEAAAAEEANANVQSYQDYIRERMERNWSRPLSARNGMVVELTIQLLRNGQVVSVAVAKSSGDPAFDRSAEQAVRKVDRFERLQELPESVYTKNFRRFTLVFRAQDLRL